MLLCRLSWIGGWLSLSRHLGLKWLIWVWGVARAVLGDEPCRDPRPWVRGCEGALQRKAESEAEFRAASYEVRRCKRRRSAWLREKEVSWWDSQAQLVQDKADQGDAFGVFATFKELRNRGATVHLGDVRPADVEAERDAWAEHFRLIGGRRRFGFGSCLE